MLCKTTFATCSETSLADGGNHCDILRPWVLAKVRRKSSSWCSLHCPPSEGDPKGGQFFRDRQTAYVIYGHFRVTGTHESILDFSDLMGVNLRGDDAKGFDTGGDAVLLSIKEMPQHHTLASLHKMRTRESEPLKTGFASYDQDIEQKDFTASYQQLRIMAKKFLDQKTTESKFRGQKRTNRYRNTGEKQMRRKIRKR